MNVALLQTFADLTAVLEQKECSAAEGARRIKVAADLYGNGYSESIRQALRAYMSSRPAWWTTAGYSSARASDLADDLNRGTDFATALVEAYPDKIKDQRIRALGTLVPLNLAAVAELMAAYQDHGSWREPEELEARRIRDPRKSPSTTSTEG